jgi:hypothetical protein
MIPPEKKKRHWFYRATRAVGRGIIIAIGLAVVVAILLWTGWPQRKAIERIAKTSLGLEADLGKMTVLSPMNIEHVRLYNITEGVRDAQPTAAIEDVRVRYTLDPGNPRYFDDVNIGSLAMNIVMGPEGRNNLGSIGGDDATREGPSMSRRTMLSYIPRAVDVDSIALSFEGQTGKVRIDGLSSEIRVNNIGFFRAELNSENLSGQWSMSSDNQVHDFKDGSVEIRAERRLQEFALSPFKVQIPGVAGIDGSVRLEMAHLLRGTVTAELNACTLDEGASIFMKEIAGLPPIAFKHADLSGSKIAYEIGSFAGQFHMFQTSVKVEDLRIGEENALLYNGDLSVEGKYETGEGGFDIVVANGKKMTATLVKEESNNAIKVSIAQWSWHDFVTALPERTHGVLNSIKAVSGLDADVLLFQVPNGIEFELDAGPVVPIAGDKDLRAKLTASGTVAYGDAPGSILSCSGSMVWPGDMGQIDLMADVSRDFSSVTGSVNLKEVAIPVLASLAGISAAPDAQPGAASGSIDFESKMEPGGTTKFTFKVSSELEEVLSNLGVSGIRGVANLEGKGEILGDAIVLSPTVSLENAVIASSFPLMAAPVVAHGTVKYSTKTRELAGSNWTAGYTDGTRVSSKDFLYTVSDSKLHLPFDLESDMTPLVGFGFLESADGLAHVVGDAGYAGGAFNAKANLDVQAKSFVLPRRIAVATDAIIKAAFTYSTSLSGSGQVSLATLAAAGVALNGLEAPLEFEGDGIKIRDLKANLFGGTSIVDVDAHLLAQGAPINVTAKFENLDLAAFTSEFKPPGASFTGIANGALDAAIQSGKLTALRVSLKSTEGFTANRDLIKKLLMSEYVTGVPLSGKVRDAIDKTIGEDIQRPFDSASLDLELKGDALVGSVPLKSKNINLNIELSVELAELYAALALRQEAQLENIANVGLAPVQ